jgi:hypothetical protein
MILETHESLLEVSVDVRTPTGAHEVIDSCRKPYNQENVIGVKTLQHPTFPEASASAETGSYS